MKKLTRHKSILLVFFLSSIIVFWLYHEVLLHPNSYIFTIDTDGIPNYFTFLYHIKNDPGYFSFQGMNYPYGESLLMVDCHPLLSTIIKFFSNNIYDISYYSVGILNLAMISSIIVCALFLLLIMDWYRFPWYISIAGSISIAFLASNVLLWRYGHYALSYSCFFPITWLLILKFFSTDKKTKYSLLLLANSLFWFYTHNYLGLIILGFTFLMHFYSFLFKTIRFNAKNILYFVIQVIVPAIIVFVVIKINDTHTHRIDMPYTSEFRASVYSVFFPNFSYLKPLYSSIFNLSRQSTQSWCQIGNYIGFSTNLILLTAIIYLLFKLVIKKRWLLNELLSKNEMVLLLSVVTLLLYSMAIPFKYGLDFLLPLQIKQFVAIGRFAWPFFFAVIVLSFILLRNMFRQNIAAVICLLAALILFSESLSYHLPLRKEIVRNDNFFKSDKTFNEVNSSGINFSDYQAILPIPFYHKYISLNAFEGSPKSVIVSTQLSYQSGLPLMSAILSRSSILESKNIIQIFNPPFYDKPVLKKMNKKPLLVLYTKEKTSSLESEFLSKCQKIFENQEIILFQLEMDSISRTNNSSYIADFINQKNEYQQDKVSGYYFKDSCKIYYDSFDSRKCDICYRGSGAMSMEKNKFNTIFTSQPNQFEKEVEYNLSFWYYNHDFDQSFNTMWLEIKDSAGQIIYSSYFDPVKSNKYDGDWAYNEQVFKLASGNCTIGLFSQGSGLYSKSIYVDELLIRPNQINIYKPLNDQGNLVLRNNETIKNQ